MQKHESLPGRGLLQELPLTISLFWCILPTHSRAVLFLMFFLGKCLHFSIKLVKMQFCSKRTPCDSQKEIAYEHNSRRKHLKKNMPMPQTGKTRKNWIQWLFVQKAPKKSQKKNELTPRDWLQDTVWPRHSLTVWPVHKWCMVYPGMFPLSPLDCMPGLVCEAPKTQNGCMRSGRSGLPRLELVFFASELLHAILH